MGTAASLYLDANATELPRPEAREAMLAAFDASGNPSSVHGMGRAARSLLEQARERIASLLGADVRRLIFTGGGTEANALALHALGAGRRLVIGCTEHESVRSAASDAMTIPVLSDGTIDLDALEAALRGEPPAMVALMLANNETGVLHPIAQAAALCRNYGALLHVDAVQAFGRIPVSIAELGADSLAVSGHKVGGPMGAGALLLATDRAPLPLIAGGGQESGWRGGSQALPAIAGFAAAAQVAYAVPNDLSPIRDWIARRAVEVGAVECGTGPRLPNTVCLALPGVAAQTQLIALDMKNIHVSAGAACSSGKVARSHVLEAMALGPLAGEAIRVSLPWSAQMEDAVRFVEAYVAVAKLAPVHLSGRF